MLRGVLNKDQVDRVPLYVIFQEGILCVLHFLNFCCASDFLFTNTFFIDNFQILLFVCLRLNILLIDRFVSDEHALQTVFDSCILDKDVEDANFILLEQLLFQCTDLRRLHRAVLGSSVLLLAQITSKAESCTYRGGAPSRIHLVLEEVLVRRSQLGGLGSLILL